MKKANVTKRIASNLKKARISARAVTQKPEDTEMVIKRMEKAAADQEKILDAAQKISSKRFSNELARAAEIETKFQSFVSTLSTVPEDRRAQDNYVKPGQSIEDATEKTIIASLTKINAPSEGEGGVGTIGRVALTKDQMAKLQEDTINFTKDMLVEDFETILNKPRTSGIPSIVLDDPLDRVCDDQRFPGDKCDEILRDLAESHEISSDANSSPNSPSGSTAGTTNVSPATEADIPVYVAKALAGIASPDSNNAPNEKKRPSAGDVQADVDRFTLKGGPADNTAFFDFHNLQIAFEYVWQEAFDEDALKLARDAYRHIVDAGGDLPATSTENPLGAIFNAMSLTLELLPDDPPSNITQAFQISKEQWHVLPPAQRTDLVEISNKIADLMLIDGNQQFIWQVLAWGLRKRGEQIIHYAESKVASSSGKFTRLHELLGKLEKRLKEPYAFTVYAANKSQRSVNFGIVATYRQRWDPINYQAGRLVKTIPLAPKEVRKFSKKFIVKKSRAEKEVQNNLRSKKEDSTETSRAEAEIIQKAQNKTSFNLAAEGGFNLGVGSGKASTGFTKDAATESQEVKRDFREAVLKSAEEYKNERTLEINTADSIETDAEESGEISNPNDEIPVTYLFYELQRRYRVSEKIHRITPVVLVAQELPRPDEIDDDWLVAHDWILKRVILDDSFIPALGYLSTKVVGDEFALEEMRKNLQQQRNIVEILKDELVTYDRQVGFRYAALEKSIQHRADVVGAEEGEGTLDKIDDWFSGGGTGESVEKIRIIEDAAKDAYERAAKEEKDVRAKLEREVTALTATTETYTKALSDNLNRKEQISRLRVHVKDNILYYMQAIWSYEPPDQRFFRLHKVKVPDLRGTRKVRFNPAVNDMPIPPTWDLTAMGTPVSLGVTEFINLPPQELKFKTLVEVADLDNLLGFKGNYIIFPLKESNDLTDFMMRPYVDDLMGLRDPDDLGNWSLDDFAKYVCCMKKKSTAEEFKAILPTLQAYYQRLLSAPRRTVDEIIVPTDSLFIEALPGAHPILEDFKLKHRAVDVRKVEAEVRHAELENIRAAARILAGEREDPDIEKKIIIEGNNSNVIVPPEDT